MGVDVFCDLYFGHTSDDGGLGVREGCTFRMFYFGTDGCGMFELRNPKSNMFQTKVGEAIAICQR